MQCDNYIIEPQEDGDTKTVRCPADALLPVEEVVAGRPITLYFCFECHQAVHGDDSDDDDKESYDETSYNESSYRDDS